MSTRAVAVRRRRALVLAAMALLTAAGVLLAVAGLSTVRNSTAGNYQEATAPDQPGYQAQVVPTPTMAVLHRGPDGELAGAWVLALEPDDDGGSVVVVPPGMVVPRPGGAETTVAEVYRRDGAAAAAQAVGEAATVAVPEHTEVDAARWERLVESVGSVEVTLDAPLAGWEAGPVALGPADVGRFLAARAEGESDLDRVERQVTFWNAWLPLVAQPGDVALPGEVDTGMGRFVRGVARGGGTAAAALPVQLDDGGAALRFRRSPAAGDFISRTVPYPRSPAPGARIRVRLLNGTGDPGLTSEVARRLVAGGAEISIAGNAESFDVDETVVAYTGADREPLALWLRAKLDRGEVEEAPAGSGAPVASDDEIDVTVILGHDAEDLTGR